MTAIAFDIGGAHLKVARVSSGIVEAAREVPCPLWLGLHQLDTAFAAVADMTPGAERRAVTMTGELTEIFPSRHDGVIALIDAAGRHLGDELEIYMGLAGLAPPARARSDTMAVASANFLATAQVIAKQAPGSLLIDFGSTTTDIIACDRPMGLSDAERLQTGELVYTGMTRTPVPSVTRRGVLAGQWQGLAADAFATMGDVRTIIASRDDGNGDVDQTHVQSALVSFARGFGRDADMSKLAVWRAAARYIRDVQLREIVDGALHVMSRPGTHITRVVTAGVGAGEAKLVADRLGLPSLAFGELIPCASPEVQAAATAYAPAVALAVLADAAGNTQPR